MNWTVIQLWKRLRHFRTDADLDDELRSHLQLQIEEYEERGVSLIEARRLARLKFGGETTVIERVRDQEVMTMLESFYNDLLYGLRSIRKSPSLSITAILTLALGIGANTAIFSLLYGLFLSDLPVSHPSQLADVAIRSKASRDNGAGALIPYLMLDQLRREQQSFSGLSAWSRSAVTMKDSEGALRFYNIGLVSGNGFALLGIHPHLGRSIQPPDDVRGGSAQGWVAVISYGFWKDNFGGDSRIIGKSITLSDTPVTVVGVAPPDFRGVWPGSDIKFYLPIQFVNILTKKDVLNTPTSFYLCSAIGRLKPGIPIARAQSEIASYQESLFRSFVPARYQKTPYFQQATLRVESARHGLPTAFGHLYSRPLYLLQGLVALVLLLCCVNVGGLMISKVYTRQREFAVRTALGAARWRLIRQYLTESFVIAFVGAALGGIAAWYSIPVLLHFFRSPMMFNAMSVQPNRAIFWETGFSALAATIFFGALPAWRAGASDPGSLLKSRTSVSNRRQIAGRAFVPAQVALSLTLVVLAALLSESLIRLRDEPTGFDLAHVTIQTPQFNMLPEKNEALLDVYRRMANRIQQMPGVRSAAVTWYTPMTGSQAVASFQALSDGPDAPIDSHMAYNYVGNGYFRTMGTHIVTGREFEITDRQQNICVVNRSAAEFLFPHQEALGHYVRSTDPIQFTAPLSCRIVGVSEDAKFADLRQPPPRTIYFPIVADSFAQTSNLVFLINSATEADSIAAYRKALTEIAPSIPLVLFATLRDQMDAALGSQRLITLMSNVFGIVALFLSALGLYGLLSSSVSQRTSEIGIRIALGAQRRTVLKMILSEALHLVGVGVILGAIILVAAVRFIQNMLYGVSSYDPLTLAAVFTVLLLVALAASLVPALRAASIDPMEALRIE